MSKKPTKREMLALIYADLCDGDNPDKEMLSEFVAKEIALLTKKSASRTVDAKKAAEQRLTMDAIGVTLGNSDESMTATAIANDLGLSVQKVSAMLRKMVTSGEVTRIEDGKKVFFTLT